MLNLLLLQRRKRLDLEIVFSLSIVYHIAQFMFVYCKMRETCGNYKFFRGISNVTTFETIAFILLSF